MTQPSEQTVSAWIALLRAHKTAMGIVETSFKEAGFPPLSWYDVLWELERAGEGGLRLMTLEERLLVSQYGVSRLVSRLEAKGLIARRPSAVDKRGQIAVITEIGKDLRKSMWPTYAAALQKGIGRHLDDAQAKTVASLLKDIAET